MIFSIQVLGVREHSKTLHLLENVKIALLQIDSEVEPSQVTDMDELIRLQISGIPALLINGQIVSQGRMLSVSEISQILKANLKENV